MVSASGGQYSVTKLEHGKKHMLRLVNTGINSWIHVSLDQHPFTVVSADFTPIVPYVTDSLALAVGKSSVLHSTPVSTLANQVHQLQVSATTSSSTPIKLKATTGFVLVLEAVDATDRTRMLLISEASSPMVIQPSRSTRPTQQGSHSQPAASTRRTLSRSSKPTSPRIRPKSSHLDSQTRKQPVT
jgi:hypothetical protein